MTKRRAGSAVCECAGERRNAIGPVFSLLRDKMRRHLRGVTLQTPLELDAICQLRPSDALDAVVQLNLSFARDARAGLVLTESDDARIAHAETTSHVPMGSQVPADSPQTQHVKRW